MHSPARGRCRGEKRGHLFPQNFEAQVPHVEEEEEDETMEAAPPAPPPSPWMRVLFVDVDGATRLTRLQNFSSPAVGDLQWLLTGLH